MDLKVVMSKDAFSPCDHASEVVEYNSRGVFVLRVDLSQSFANCLIGLSVEIVSKGGAGGKFFRVHDVFLFCVCVRRWASSLCVPREISNSFYNRVT